MANPKLEEYQHELLQEYNHLLGKRLVPDEKEDPLEPNEFRAKDVEGRLPTGGWVRVVTPNARITKDLRHERINIQVDAQGIVQEFKFY